MTDFETHPVGTADLVKRLRDADKPLFAQPITYREVRSTIREAADRIEQLEAALTRANAATAAAVKQLAVSRETFCYASPGSDEEFTSLLLGFDTAAGIIRALSTPDQTAALDRLIADAVKPYVDALIWCSGSADFNEGGFAREGWQKLCAPLLAASKKGGA
jgi:hypothetical protein